MSNQSNRIANSVMEDNENVNAGDESDGDDDEGIFEVDYLMDMKVKKGVRYFYVRWKGYDETEDSWEPEENLEGARAILDRFLADFKPKTKGRQSKTTPKPAAAASSSSRKRSRHSREPSKEASEPEAKSDSDDDDFGQGKRKKKKIGDEASTSKSQRSKTENYTSVPALNTCIKRRMMNSNLRWLEDDSDEASDNDANQKSAVLNQPVPPVVLPKPDPVPTIERIVTNESPDKSKEKKKKKKSKKHSKDRERSNPSPENDRRTNNNMLESAKLTFLGLYRPDETKSGELQFIVRNNSTNIQSTKTLGEAFLEDPWHLCTYLASKIKFQSHGEAVIAVENGDAKK